MVQSGGGFAAKVLANQLKELSQNDESGFSVGLENDNNMFKWNIIFNGPEDTPYEGGYFKATMEFPSDFPESPPKMKFVTPMWHPNIYEDGNVCISILHSDKDPMYDFEGDARWRPILGVEAILLSVISMLNDPNIESPANVDASKEWRDERNKYNAKVR